MTNNINQVFGLTSSNTAIAQIPQREINPELLKSEQELQADYQSSIDDYTTLMDQGKAALEEILSIATESQNARFFEAAALMLKTLADTNAGRMDVHHKLFKIKEIKKNLGIENQKTVIQKAVFIGSTSDLLKQVKPREIEIDDAEITYEDVEDGN